MEDPGFCRPSLAGVPFNDKNPNGAAAGLKNYIHIAGNYSFNAIKSSLANTNPTTGIRSILNNNGQSPVFGTIAGEYGPQPIVTVDGKYTADINAGYGNGVYVSGKWDQQSLMPTVNLNDTDIKITGSGNALKIGKKDRSVAGVRQIRDGWGAGQLNFKDGSTVNIDQTAATGEAIAVTFGGSILNAPGTKAFKVNAQGNSIRIGNDILTNSVQASTDLIDVKINNAYFRTTTPTTSLIRVDPQQKNVSLLFTGAGTDLTAASDGYIIDVQGTGANSSATLLVFDTGATTTGLVNKTADSTLNVGLSNGSTWNLAVKTSAAVATSTFNTLTMTTGSTLNAFNQLDPGKTSATQFIMAGQVSSDASTTNLWDPTPTPDDALTITGNYTGANNAVLAVDTCLGNSSAPSDTLTVSGTADGATLIKVHPVTGADCAGAATTGDGILVVQTGGSGDATFALDGGTVTQGHYVYRLVKVGNNWYLQSTSTVGSLVVSKSVSVPSGSGASFSGSIPFSVTCTGPDFSASDAITVTNNVGADVTVNNVPVGSQCTVAEGVLPSPPAGYSWGSVSYTQPTGAMTPDGVQQAAISNVLLNIPMATLSCTPESLFDSDGNVATCTVTLNAPAPAGGLPIALTLPASNPRYSTTCATPLTVAAGATTASCTITATPNTAAGDGDVTATLALAAGTGYSLGTPATAMVTVKDDDTAAGVQPVPTLSQWALMLLSLGIAGLAVRRRSR